MLYIGRECEVINKMNCRCGEIGVVKGYRNIFRETALEVEFADETKVLMYPKELKFDTEEDAYHRCESCTHDDKCTKRVYDIDDRPHFINGCSRWERR